MLARKWINMCGRTRIVILLLIWSIAAMTFLIKPVYADAKDSDLDGISDEAELNLYHTNPNNPDTDNDGIPDFREILDQTNPNNANSSTTANTKKDPIAWYVARITGITAFIMLTLVVSFGLLMSSKSLLKFKFISAPNALDTHSFIALCAILLVVVHFSSLFFDPTMQLKIFEALVPFQIQRSFTSSLGFDLNYSTALGIIAFYIGVILVFTSFFRRKIVSLKIWRTIHYSSFLFYILFLAHGVLTGSDSGYVWMKIIYAASSTLVLTLLMLRIFGKRLFLPTTVKTTN